MSFIDQAKEVLTPEQVTRLELLAMKSANFETSMEEIDEMKALKQEVVKLIASRDRQKNLAFLKDGAYDIKDILEAMGKDHHAVIKDSGLKISDIFKLMNITKKEAMSAIKEVYVGGAKSYTELLATYGSDDVFINTRDRAILKTVRDGGEKLFAQNVTDEAKAEITKGRDKKRGTGKTYELIQAIALKFKFDKQKLMEAFGLTEEEPKAEEKAPAKTEEKKDLGAAANPQHKKQTAAKAA